MSVIDVGAVSISDCACSLHVEVHCLCKVCGPPTKSMAPPLKKARMRAAEGFDVKERQHKHF